MRRNDALAVSGGVHDPRAAQARIVSERSTAGGWRRARPVRRCRRAVSDCRRRPWSRRRHAQDPEPLPARADGPFPGGDGRRIGGGVHRLSGPAQQRARSDQGRHPVPPERHTRRSQSPRHVDDLEVRRGRAAVRRRQRRSPGQPEAPLSGRTAESDTAVYDRDSAVHRTQPGYSGPGRQHQPPDHGLADGHLLDECRVLGARRDHRQADRAWGIRRAE